jgi:hypothetical protein
VIRAIEKDKAQIVVMRGPGLMDLFPGLGPAMNRISGAERLMASVADYGEAARNMTRRREPARSA